MHKLPTIVNKTAILSVGQAFGCEPQQEGLYIAADSIHIPRKPEVVLLQSLLGV